MSIKSVLRDGSFRRFVFGGVVLLAVASVGIYFAKQNTVPTDVNSSDNVAVVTEQTDTNNNNQTTESPKTENSSERTDSDVVTDSLPESGPAHVWRDLLGVASVTYILAYFCRETLV